MFTVWLPGPTARAKNNIGLAGHVPAQARPWLRHWRAEGHVRKFRQEDFQDEDNDDKMKCTYNGNSTQHQ